MEIQSTFDYHVPDYECYQALKDHILPGLDIVYKVGYIPTGKVSVKVVEAHEPACFIKGKMRIKAYNVLPYAVGPNLEFTCRNNGNNRCTVVMVSDASFYKNFLLNLTADLGKGLYPKFVLKMMPKAYFDGTVVYDNETYLSESYRDDANVRAFKYIFNKAGDQLARYLEAKFRPR